MARIKDYYDRARKDSGYERSLGNSALAQLISATHACVISAGSELERLVADQGRKIDDLDQFLTTLPPPDGVYLVGKRQLKNSSRLRGAPTEPDFLIFEKSPDRQQCIVIELKDGDQFDTKKAKGEWSSLNTYLDFISRKIAFSVSARVCFFNATSREVIVEGFKRVISEADAITGPEICELLGLDYYKIVADRRSHQPENLKFFLERLGEIPEIVQYLRSLK